MSGSSKVPPCFLGQLDGCTDEGKEAGALLLVRLLVANPPLSADGVKERSHVSHTPFSDSNVSHLHCSPNVVLGFEVQRGLHLGTVGEDQSSGMACERVAVLLVCRYINCVSNGASTRVVSRIERCAGRDRTSCGGICGSGCRDSSG